MKPFSGAFDGYAAIAWCKKNAQGNCSVLVTDRIINIVYVWSWTSALRWTFKRTKNWR